MSFPSNATGIYCPGCSAGDFPQPHICGAPFAPFQAIPPISLYTIQKCPVCEGCGRVPRDFYGETKNNSKQIICQTCHGAGILKAMTKNGETPASNEEQSPGGGWSEAYSSIGRRYTWVPSLGKVFVTEGWHA